MNDLQAAKLDDVVTMLNTPVGIVVSDLLADKVRYVMEVTRPVNGIVKLAHGLVTFSPTLGFTGTAGFDYVVVDDMGESTEVHVVITVKDAHVYEGWNDTPSTVEVDLSHTQSPPKLSMMDGSVRTIKDVPVAITYFDLTGAVDNQGMTLNVSNPTNGRIELPADATVVFVPGLEFTGVAGFDYSIEDEQGETASAHVTVFVDQLDSVGSHIRY